MGKVVAHFRSHLQILSESERLVLFYVDNHIDQMENINLVQLANITKVSTTTVIRMCQKIGLEGYSEFKYILKELKGDSITYDKDFISSFIFQLTETINSVNTNDLQRMANIIKQAKSVFIVSVGLTKSIGEYATQRLIQTNKPTMHAYESHLIDLLPNLIKNNDVVIFISTSGKTNTLIDAAQKLRFTGANLFSLTNAADSKLSQLTNFNLSSSFKTQTFSGYDITPRTPLSMLVDLLIEKYLIEAIYK
ncbi:MurR/RpiR family transcriptional regulator [Priestia megaterium]|uniref:MurR/RpiR family transcriptional regulator n=1 Tax=Priestia megaterium TaxID=1404 RepID=UPI0039F74353